MSQTWKIIIAVIITALIVGGGFYFWQQNKGVETEKTFQGAGFTFTYPAEYIADETSLWSEVNYQNRLTSEAPTPPDIDIKNTISRDSLDRRILNDFDLPGETLADMAEQTEIKYETIKIGDKDFTKITVYDMLETTGYYTKQNDQVVSFWVYNSQKEKDTQALIDILSTLKFE